MTNATTNWPDLAIGLYERLTGHNAEISYEFQDFDLYVPSEANNSADTAQAKWRMNGVLKIRSRNGQNESTGG